MNPMPTAEQLTRIATNAPMGAAELLETRTKLGLSQPGIAYFIGLGVAGASTIVRWERGIRPVHASSAKLLRVAIAFPNVAEAMGLSTLQTLNPAGRGRGPRAKRATPEAEAPDHPQPASPSPCE